MNRGFFNKAFVSYLLISVLITISMLDPLNFSRKTSVNTRKIYNHIENELATGGHILVDLHYGLLARTALEPQLTIIVKHLFDKNCKIVFLSTSNEGPAMFKKFQLQAPDVFVGRRYGVDYVFLGSISSGEAGVASLAKSIRETVSKDYYNTPTTDYIKLPIMKNLNGAESFALAFILSIEVKIFEWYVRTWAMPYSIPLLLGTLNPTSRLAELYLNNGWVIGIIAGYEEVAEYEILAQREGLGLNAIKARKTAHILTVLFMIFGNFTVFYLKSKLKALTFSS